MKKVCVIILMMALLIMPGCGNLEDTSRYPFVAIPCYEMKDYYELLSYKQPEIVYNAVSNLIGYTSVIGGILSNKEADKNSENYVTALKTYKKILELLSSRDSKIQAAALKFLERMSTQYNRPEELILSILRVQSNSQNVQYEQVFALSAIAGKNSQIGYNAVKKFLQSRNWMVSRQAYLLVNKLEDEQCRIELIKKYNLTKFEFEKLLILGALKNNFSSFVFKFLTKEIISSGNRKIRHVIFDILGTGKNKQEVLKWIDNNYGVFSKEDVACLVDIYSRAFSKEDVDFSSSLFIVLINHGFTPQEKFYKELNSSIKELMGKPEYEEKFKSLILLDEALSNNASLKDVWLSVKNGKPVNKAMEKEYNDALDQFISKTDKILKKYNAEEEARKEYINEISSLKDYMIQKFSQ